MQLLPLLLALVLLRLGPIGPVRPLAPTDGAPVMQNPGFECGEGYHDEPGIHGMVANGWTGKILRGEPFMVSTQMWAKYSCDPYDLAWEKLEGHDSNIFLATEAHYGQGFVAPPFDVVVYQPVAVTKDVEYSLSAWMVSLCGGSGPSDTCPTGAYIAKMTGLDPTGGTDPLSPTVQWTEDRRSHFEARWVNLIDATTAQTATLTVFVRVNSPFLYEGNHAFADAVKLVRAPTSAFTGVTPQGEHISVSWSGSLGPDIPNIPATNHKLSLELEVKAGDGAWLPWLSGQNPGSLDFVTPHSCSDTAFQFRIRAWATQPAGVPGAWPNHRFVGPWHDSAKVQVGRTSVCTPRAHLPFLLK